MEKNFTPKTKLRSVFKLCVVQAMIAMTLFGVSMAHDNDVQLPDKKVILNLKKVSLEKKALKEIASITGKVTDAVTQQPMPGVNIIQKGTNNGTTTGGDGRYSLEVLEADAVLVFSFIGYITQEVAVNGRTVIDVALSEDIETLEEVVIIGYGEVKKRDLTGSVVSMDSKNLNPGAQLSVDQLLQGRAPGVQLTQISAKPGGGFSIRIRGANSLTAGNEPLYVIDGMPTDPLNAVNPADIESIEILKDASATAIYGSRGANGVIFDHH